MANMSMLGVMAEEAVRASRQAIEWLAEERGIDAEVALAAAQAGTVGWVGEAPEAFAAIVRDLRRGYPLAVDLRYVSGRGRGGAFCTYGCRHRYGWTSSSARLRRAQTLYITEGVVSALAVESAGLRGEHAVMAIRGAVPASKQISLGWVHGRRTIIVPDHDALAPNGRRPGSEAALEMWRRLAAQGVPCEVVDVSGWGDPARMGDIADVLKAEGAPGARAALLNTVSVPEVMRLGAGRG